MWFRPDFRLGFAGPDCKVTSDKDAWMRGSGFKRHSDPDLVTWQTGHAVSAGGMGMGTSMTTKERITCLCGLWGQTHSTSGETCAGADFQQAAYEVLYECVWSMRKVLKLNQAKRREVKQQPRINRKAMRFSIVGQLPLEIVAWLRDVFGLEQQVVTSALTINCLFPVALSGLGMSWGDSPVGYYWTVTVDNFCPDQTGPVTPWAHRCLLVLNEPREGALSRVWEKITSTARLRRVVVVVHERPGGKRLPWKHYMHHSTNDVTCIELAIFTAGTISFGHAAGWNDYADRNGRSANPNSASSTHSHTWTCDEDGHLSVPDTHCPGVLRRHAGLLNMRDVHILLLDPPSDTKETPGQ